MSELDDNEIKNQMRALLDYMKSKGKGKEFMKMDVLELMKMIKGKGK